MNNTEHISHSEAETFEIARRLGGSLEGKEIIGLTGELGAGKTIFVKGLAAGLGLQDVNQVCSPSFTLMNIYQARVSVYHLDFYRLGTRVEIEDLGWEDFIGEGVILIEWAEKYDVQHESIHVEITVSKDESRRIRITHYE
jgi:tRNA threonylcarbamoyladenosine biosynthesis protein TsaE